MVQRLGFLGVRAPSAAAFQSTVALYRDILAMEPFRDEPDAVWFRASDGAEIHVYGPGDADHEFFGAGPVVGLVVDDFDAARAALVAAGIAFIGEPQRAGDAAWNHYVGPDGNVYEIMGRNAAHG